jgi:hypothetical protein
MRLPMVTTVPVGQLAPPAQASFKAEHLAEVEALRTRDGIRMEVPVLFTGGRVPSRS